MGINECSELGILRGKVLGILRGKVIKAFDNLKEGNLKEFTMIIADVSDVRYEWHKGIVLDEIGIQLKELLLKKNEKTFCKKIIKQHKRNMILDKLK